MEEEKQEQAQLKQTENQSTINQPTEKSKSALDADRLKEARRAKKAAKRARKKLRKKEAAQKAAEEAARLAAENQKASPNGDDGANKPEESKPADTSKTQEQKSDGKEGKPTDDSAPTSDEKKKAPSDAPEGGKLDEEGVKAHSTNANDKKPSTNGDNEANKPEESKPADTSKTQEQKSDGKEGKPTDDSAPTSDEKKKAPLDAPEGAKHDEEGVDVPATQKPAETAQKNEESKPAEEQKSDKQAQKPEEEKPTKTHEKDEAEQSEGKKEPSKPPQPDAPEEASKPTKPTESEPKVSAMNKILAGLDPSKLSESELAEAERAIYQEIVGLNNKQFATWLTMHPKEAACLEELIHREKTSKVVEQAQKYREEIVQWFDVHGTEKAHKTGYREEIALWLETHRADEAPKTEDKAATEESCKAAREWARKLSDDELTALNTTIEAALEGVSWTDQKRWFAAHPQEDAVIGEQHDRKQELEAIEQWEAAQNAATKTAANAQTARQAVESKKKKQKLFFFMKKKWQEDLEKLEEAAELAQNAASATQRIAEEARPRAEEAMKARAARKAREAEKLKSAEAQKPNEQAQKPEEPAEETPPKQTGTESPREAPKPGKNGVPETPAGTESAAEAPEPSEKPRGEAPEGAKHDEEGVDLPSIKDTPSKTKGEKSSAIEDVYAELFKGATAPEQEQLFEIKKKLNLREDDALWSVIFALNYYSRLYNAIPDHMNEVLSQQIEKISQSQKDYSEESKKHVEEIAQRAAARLTDYTLNEVKKLSTFRLMYLQPLGFLCFFIFCLCLLCFVGGLSFSGVTYSKSLWDTLLFAPAGWIVPFACIPFIILGAVEIYLFTGRRRWTAVGTLCLFGTIFGAICMKILNL